MNRIQLILAGAALLPSMALAYGSGPPDGHTGAPGETSCVACHTTNPLNSGNGTFQISGPDTWLPGETYELTVTLADPGQSRWGFEATQLGQGEFSEASGSLQISASGATQYIKHTSSGTFQGTSDGPVSWTFDWTAPTGEDLPEEVTFYAAGNAANGNFSNSGDFIYTTSFSTMQDLTSVEAPGLLPTDLGLANWPNPFNPETRIAFTLPSAGMVRLSVYNLAGERVRTLLDQPMPAGTGHILWNGLSDRGIAQPSGMYFARLDAAGTSQTHRMLMVK